MFHKAGSFDDENSNTRGRGFNKTFASESNVVKACVCVHVPVYVHVSRAPCIYPNYGLLPLCKLFAFFDVRLCGLVVD